MLWLLIPKSRFHDEQAKIEKVFWSFTLILPQISCFLSPEKFLLTLGNPHKPSYDERTNKVIDMDIGQQNKIDCFIA